MEQAGIALLPFLHSGVPTHVAVPFLEAHGSFVTQRLSDGDLAAFGEMLEQEILKGLNLSASGAAVAVQLE